MNQRKHGEVILSSLSLQGKLEYECIEHAAPHHGLGRVFSVADGVMSGSTTDVTRIQ